MGYLDPVLRLGHSELEEVELECAELEEVELECAEVWDSEPERGGKASAELGMLWDSDLPERVGKAGLVLMRVLL